MTYDWAAFRFPQRWAAFRGAAIRFILTTAYLAFTAQIILEELR